MEVEYTNIPAALRMSHLYTYDTKQSRVPVRCLFYSLLYSFDISLDDGKVGLVSDSNVSK